MKVQLEKTYAMPGSAEITWALLQDMEAVAGCMPGAAITERIDDQHFKGTVAVKFGPASMNFKGQIEVLALDAASRTLRLSGKGTDTTGGSGAAMDLTARVEPGDAGTSTLVGSSEVSVSGKAAAFGSRLMVPVAEQVLQQFATRFAALVQARQAAAQAPASAAAAPPASAPSPPPAEAPLNGLALAWAVFKGWLRSLFGGAGDGSRGAR